MMLLTGCGGRPPVTLVPVPDSTNRVEVRTAEAGWEQRVAELAACVMRVDLAAKCTESASPPVCDTRSKEEVLRSIQPILDSLPRVRLTNSFEMARQLAGLFPAATPTTEVLDARRTTTCKDWSGGGCAAIRTNELAFVFLGNPGGAPERVLIVRVSPACGQSRPDRGTGP